VLGVGYSDWVWALPDRLPVTAVRPISILYVPVLDYSQVSPTKAFQLTTSELNVVLKAWLSLTQLRGSSRVGARTHV
jgi:hypothetical protein